MSHSSTISFLSYWRSLQQGAAQNGPARRDDPAIAVRAPLRSSFDPVQLKDLMPQMMMIASAENNYRFRLSGGFLVALHGLELKQSSFCHLFGQAHRERLQVALGMAVHREQPLILTVSGTASENDTARYETLKLDITLAPLRNAEGVVDRLVGLYQPLGPIPFLKRETISALNLQAARLYDPQKLPRAAHLRLVSLGGQRIA